MQIVTEHRESVTFIKIIYSQCTCFYWGITSTCSVFFLFVCFEVVSCTQEFGLKAEHILTGHLYPWAHVTLKLWLKLNHDCSNNILVMFFVSFVWQKHNIGALNCFMPQVPAFSQVKWDWSDPSLFHFPQLMHCIAMLREDQNMKITNSWVML